MPQYECSTWFERDRASVTLTNTTTNKEVFSLIDEEVNEAIDSGFLPTPRIPRPSDADWLPCVIEYAKSQGLIP